MTKEENKESARRFIEEGWNDRNLDLIDELYSPDYVGHWFQVDGEDADRDALKTFIGAMHEAFPDLEMTIDFIHGEGDLVTTGVTAEGTHDGELMGIPPTGTTIRTLPAHITNRYEDGQVVEGWATWDALGMMQSIGVLPEDVSQAAPSADD